MEHDPDETLARAAQAGSKEAFSQLADRFHSRLYRFLRFRCGGRTCAEDVAQDALIRAWSQLDRYDPTRPFANWLFTIAARLAHNAVERRGTARPVMDVEELDPSADDGDPATQACRAEDKTNLWSLANRVLESVPRSALWLFYSESRSCAEVAQILGRSEGAVRTILHRARQRIAEHLEDAADETPGDVIPAPKTLRQGCRP